MPATSAGCSDGKSIKVAKKRRKLFHEDSDFVELSSQEVEEQPPAKKQHIGAKKVSKNRWIESTKSLKNQAVKRRFPSPSGTGNENVEESASSSQEQPDIKPPKKKKKVQQESSLPAVQAPKPLTSRKVTTSSRAPLMIQKSNEQSVSKEKLESPSSGELEEPPVAKIAAQKTVKKNGRTPQPAAVSRTNRAVTSSPLSPTVSRNEDAEKSVGETSMKKKKSKKKIILCGVDVEKHFDRKGVYTPLNNKPLTSFRATDIAKVVFRENGYVPMVEDMLEWQKSYIAKMYSMGYTLTNNPNNIWGKRRDMFLRIFEGLSVEKMHASYFSPMYTFSAAIYNNRELPEIKPIFCLYTKMDVAPQFLNYETKFIVNGLIFDLDLEDGAYPQPVDGKYPGIPYKIVERWRSALDPKYETLHRQIGILLKHPQRYELDRAWKLKDTLKIWMGKSLLGDDYLLPQRLTTRSNIMGPVYIKTPAERLMEKIHKLEEYDAVSAHGDSLGSASRNLERRDRIVIKDDGQILPEELENAVEVVYQADVPNDGDDFHELVDDEGQGIGYAIPKNLDKLSSALGHDVKEKVHEKQKKKGKLDKSAEVPLPNTLRAVGKFSDAEMIKGKHLSELRVGDSVLVKHGEKPLWPGVILAINNEDKPPSYDVNVLAVNNAPRWTRISAMPANTVFLYDLQYMFDVQSKEETVENKHKFQMRMRAIILFHQWKENPMEIHTYPEDDPIAEN